LERRAKKGDLVILSESGGGTALMALPAPGITLEDIQEVNRILYFGCGASMPEANAVRNMLGILRARHARYVGEATLLRISTPEQPRDLRVHLHDRPRNVNGYEYAIHILKTKGCWESVPESVRQFLLAGDPAYAPMSPHEWHEKPRFYFRVMGPEYMLEAARRKAEALGLKAEILVSSLTDIEAQAAGETLAYVAQEIDVYERPFASPCVYLCGGELLVTVGSGSGRGGRNQEFALAAAPRIAGSSRVVIGSADSDGCDGPTNVAGAIVDGNTVERAQDLGIDLFAELRNHNSNAVFEALGDTIYTGVLTTNIQDLRVVYVGPRL
jgi:glycerate-2-kinase